MAERKSACEFSNVKLTTDKTACTAAERAATMESEASDAGLK
jgi:hypothetical protein